MSTIVTRAGKGSPLTHAEVDANFTNLNTDKLDTAGIAAGTAASPTIKFTGDPNTGLYSPGADQVAITTGGTGRLFVDSAGNVGVGVTPTTVFDVYGSVKISTGGGVNDSYFGFGANYDNYFTSGSSGAQIFRAAGTERLRITSSGNVGIGTSAPGSLLDVRFATSPVNDNGNGFNALRVWTSSALAADTGGAISLGGVSTTGGTASSFAQIAGRKVNATSTDYAGYLQFSVNGAGGTMFEAMRIDSSGRLLVGTSSNAGGALLQINGDRIRVGTAKTPASATATGTTGEICWDASYIYVCTATNTWKRTALSTW